jgi:hypothetical protein
MKRIARATALAIFLGAGLPAAAGGKGAAQQPAPKREEPAAAQAKERDRQQPGFSAQTTPNCSGRPTARCTKKGVVKKLRTIF